MLAIKNSWEPTGDDGESLVDEEDVICSHLTTNSHYDSDNESFSVSNEIHCEPIVETVNAKITSKFVYEDAEEVFLTASVGAEPTSTKDAKPVIQQPGIQQADPTCVQVNDAKSMMNDDTSHNLCPDFLRCEE